MSSGSGSTIPDPSSPLPPDPDSGGPHDPTDPPSD
jgi:hypothetical protein